MESVLRDLVRQSKNGKIELTIDEAERLIAELAKHKTTNVVSTTELPKSTFRATEVSQR